MNLVAIGLDGFWAGSFALALGVLFTAPRGYAPSLFLCGLAGRVVRELLTSVGMAPSWATVLAAISVVLVAVVMTRRHAVSPVVLVSAVLPLGGAASMFHGIVAVVRITSLQGDALAVASGTLVADMSRAFTITLAMALGLGSGMALVRFLKGETVWERV
jgi:uncharacterized membrane protein YjjB (DUF3815 family)